MQANEAPTGDYDPPKKLTFIEDRNLVRYDDDLRTLACAHRRLLKDK
jgi:hypothetical protein